MDAIDPPHYRVGDTYETIKVINAWGATYCVGSAIKYLSRLNRKEGAPVVQDLRKAIRFLEFEVERLEKNETQSNSDA